MQRTFHVYAAISLLCSGGLLLAAVFSIPLSAFAQTPLTCTPSATTVTVGQSLSFTASGGTGVYSWGTPDSAIPASSLSTITYTPRQAGAMAVFVQSGTQNAACVFTAVAGTTGGGVGLPNTGGGGQNLPALLSSLALLSLAAGTMILLQRRRALATERVK